MDLDDLIATAASNRPMALADVDAVARQMGVPVVAVMDRFARIVATRYMQGEYSYGAGDIAMNQLFNFAFAGSGLGMPDFAWQVFEAFDEGEYNHAGEPEELQGEARTRKLLGSIRSLDGA